MLGLRLLFMVQGVGFRVGGTRRSKTLKVNMSLTATPNA